MASTMSDWAMEERAMSLNWRMELDTSLRVRPTSPFPPAASPSEDSMERSMRSMMCRGCRKWKTNLK